MAHRKCLINMNWGNVGDHDDGFHRVFFLLNFINWGTVLYDFLWCFGVCKCTGFGVFFWLVVFQPLDVFQLTKILLWHQLFIVLSTAAGRWQPREYKGKIVSFETWYIKKTIHNVSTVKLSSAQLTGAFTERRVDVWKCIFWALGQDLCPAPLIILPSKSSEETSMHSFHQLGFLIETFSRVWRAMEKVNSSWDLNPWVGPCSPVLSSSPQEAERCGCGPRQQKPGWH